MHHRESVAVVRVNHLAQLRERLLGTVVGEKFRARETRERAELAGAGCDVEPSDRVSRLVLDQERRRDPVVHRVAHSAPPVRHLLQDVACAIALVRAGLADCQYEMGVPKFSTGGYER